VTLKLDACAARTIATRFERKNKTGKVTEARGRLKESKIT
jgi:hypothetical protein